MAVHFTLYYGNASYVIQHYINAIYITLFQCHSIAPLKFISCYIKAIFIALHYVNTITLCRIEVHNILATHNYLLSLTSFHLPYRKASPGLPGMFSTILLRVKNVTGNVVLHNTPSWCS